MRARSAPPLYAARRSVLNLARPVDTKPLPKPPAIAIEIVDDRTSRSGPTGGFLDLQRLTLRARFPDGSASEPFSYDVAVRRALDVVAIAAHFDVAGERRVFLRSSVRPPLALRDVPPLHDGNLWELPAGLIDSGETPAQAAARELEEELGFRIDASSLRELGAWQFPVSGMCAERHCYFEIAVDPNARGVPTEDGSPLERFASIVDVPLAEAIAACMRGEIRDSKTEIALRRLAESIGAPAPDQGIVR
jgi:ADP-ribose pyrophosphatase